MPISVTDRLASIKVAMPDAVTQTKAFRTSVKLALSLCGHFVSSELM
jgi:hypothetical protein